MEHPTRRKEIETALAKDGKFVTKRLEPDVSMKLVRGFDVNSFEEFGFGCILGNFLADAIGAKDEFASNVLKEHQLIETMKMPGGGQHKVAPGQGTDDSELATSLMLGLIDQNVKSYMADQKIEIKLNMDKVCARYKDWYNSEPFD